MRNILSRSTLLFLVSAFVLFGIAFFFQPAVEAQDRLTVTVRVDQSALGFTIPTLSDVLTFIIRGFFIIAGLAALFYLLLGAFTWVTSGGEEDNVKKARDKITAAIIGVILIVVVLAVIVTLEQVVFQSRICFGLSCAASIPDLVEPCGVGTCDVDCDNYYDTDKAGCENLTPPENNSAGDLDPSSPGGFDEQTPEDPPSDED